jgi:energy-coupling factor transport system permease protein
LPPEIKIILYVVFIATLFLLQDFTVYIIILFIMVIFLIRIPWKSLKSGWIPISLLILFTFVSNVFFQSGKIFYKAGPFSVTEEGITIALIRTMRLFFMIAGAKILTATTPIESLVGAFERMLKPLERFGVPVAEFFSTAGLAMKSIPRLKDHVIDTYKKKVHEDSISGFWGRIRVVSIFLIPLMAKGLQSPEIFFKDDKKIE